MTRKRDEPSELERAEIEGVVCDYFCHEGLTAVRIQERVLAEFGAVITREEAYRFVRKAARNGDIRYIPPQERSLKLGIKEQHYPWLQAVSVVQTARCEGVAARGALMLLELLQQHYSGDVVHVGFSGGVGLRTLAREFGRLLREPHEHLPTEIVFHAMVAGFDVDDPTTDPNAFFAYFVNDPAMEVKTSFVGLHAPAMAPQALIDDLITQPGIREAYQRAHEINVIVTGASCSSDAHSPLNRYLTVANEPKGTFGKDCAGDMLWQPVGKDGPIEMGTELKAVTLKELNEVGDFVKNKNQVLLVAGPCSQCHYPKTEVVHALLNQPRKLITHLAIDSRCARDVLAL